MVTSLFNTVEILVLANNFSVLVRLENFKMMSSIANSARLNKIGKERGKAREIGRNAIGNEYGNMAGGTKLNCAVKDLRGKPTSIAISHSFMRSP